MDLANATKWTLGMILKTDRSPFLYHIALTLTYALLFITKKPNLFWIYDSYLWWLRYLLFLPLLIVTHRLWAKVGDWLMITKDVPRVREVQIVKNKGAIGEAILYVSEVVWKFLIWPCWIQEYSCIVLFWLNKSWLNWRIGEAFLSQETLLLFMT